MLMEIPVWFSCRSTNHCRCVALLQRSGVCAKFPVGNKSHNQQLQLKTVRCYRQHFWALRCSLSYAAAIMPTSTRLAVGIQRVTDSLLGCVALVVRKLRLVW